MRGGGGGGSGEGRKVRRVPYSSSDGGRPAEREKERARKRERESTHKRKAHQHDSLVLREDLNQRVGEHAFHGVHCSVPLLLASVSVTAERNAELHVGVVGRNFGFGRGRSWRREGVGIEGRREEEEEEEKG